MDFGVEGEADDGAGGLCPVGEFVTEFFFRWGFLRSTQRFTPAAWMGAMKRFAFWRLRGRGCGRRCTTAAKD